MTASIRRQCGRRRTLSNKSWFWMVAALLIGLHAGAAVAQSSQWIRPSGPNAPLIWGRRDGIVFGLNSQGGIRGPRGLIRVGPWSGGNLQNELLNFIAVEPVAMGAGPRGDRMAFSELEMSELDPGKRGKRMWVEGKRGPDDVQGDLETMHVGDNVVERLSVRVNVERYTANGAHVYLIVSIDSDQPNELRLAVFAEKDSPALQELTLTATMGNYERLRWLWLNGRTESSHKLFGNYTGNEFVENGSFPLDEILRNTDGDAIVYCSTDETDPGKTAGNDTAHWPYTLPKLTQYWRIPSYDVQPDLRVRVNARRVYWASTAPVPGGIAFENFETRQRYIPGQTFIFGIGQKEPWELYTGDSKLPAAGFLQNDEKARP